MRRPGLSAVLALVLVFLSGAVVGAFGYRVYAGKTVRAAGPSSPEEFRRQYVSEMTARLKLSPEQITRLGAILDHTRELYQAFREKHRPEMVAIQDEQVRKISAILNETQRQEYDKMRIERDRRRREGKK